MMNVIELPADPTELTAAPNVGAGHIVATPRFSLDPALTLWTASYCGLKHQILFALRKLCAADVVNERVVVFAVV